MGNNDYTYVKAFEKFDYYVTKNNKVASDTLHIGYLINLQQVNNFRQIKEEQPHSICSSSEKITKLNPENPQEITNQINKGVKFILINHTLYTKICIENSINPCQIKYRIYQEYINIYITNNVILKVEKNDQNIIDRTKLIEKNEIDDKIVDKIYTDIANFYNIEKIFEEKLNNRNTVEKYNGFLVDNIWVEKWRKYSYYDIIKTKYLQNNEITDKNEITDMIKEEQRKNYYNYNELNDIENYTLKNNKDINLKENLEKSFAILDLNFLKLFKFNKSIAPTVFNLNYQTISIVEATGMIYKTFKTTNNIIAINGNNLNDNLNKSRIINGNIYNTYSNEYLRHLIRTIFFKKEFLSPLNKYKNNLTKANLIKSDIINDLVQKFKLNELIKKIENNPLLNSITYENFDNNFNEILRIINETDSNYLNSIKQYDNPGAIKLIQNESYLIPKYNNQNKFKYIDNFEIIDDKFTSFLKTTFYGNVSLPLVYFGLIENYILLIIIVKNDVFYEIASFNQSNCAFTVEYFIEIVNNNKYNDINTLNNNLFQFLVNNRIQNILSTENKNNIGNNNIIFNIHSISNNHEFNNGINKSQYNTIVSIKKNKKESLKKGNSLRHSMNSMNLKNFPDSHQLHQNINLETTNLDGNNKDILRQSVIQTKSKLSEKMLNDDYLDKKIYLINNDFSDSNHINAQNNYLNNINNNKFHSNTQLLPKKNKNLNLNQLETDEIKENPINDNNNAILNKNDNNDNENLNYFLKFAIELIKQRNSLIEIITKSINDPNKEYYLINKKYINYLRPIFHLKEIKEIMLKTPTNNDEEMLNIINTKLPEEIKNNIKQLQKNIIQQDLDKLSVNNDKTKIANYDIITKEIMIKLNEIDKNIGKKYQKVNCVFNSNKIIIITDKKIIYIVDYKEDNIFFEYMIESENSDLLFNCFKQKGYQFILPYISYNKIYIPINQNYIIKTKIYKLTPNGLIEFRISNELKTLILLAYSQNFFSYNQIHKVYLINYKWLKHFKYEEIKSLVDNSLKNKPFTNINDINSASNLIPMFTGITSSISFSPSNQKPEGFSTPKQPCVPALAHGSARTSKQLALISSLYPFRISGSVIFSLRGKYT
mgnify:CR=1 FL=1